MFVIYQLIYSYVCFFLIIQQIQCTVQTTALDLTNARSLGMSNAANSEKNTETSWVANEKEARR